MTANLQSPQTRQQWREALAALPSVPPGGKIPAFYFGHGRKFLYSYDYGLLTCKKSPCLSGQTLYHLRKVLIPLWGPEVL